MEHNSPEQLENERLLLNLEEPLRGLGEEVLDSDRPTEEKDQIARYVIRRDTGNEKAGQASVDESE
ncbi:MAG: hypothetical protein U5L95_05675 [Candidatus Saccharibacteria bacterium]|nr:hypothetical protein [Candidatus Saccharibacteria bacterium]